MKNMLGYVGTLIFLCSLGCCLYQFGNHWTVGLGLVGIFGGICAFIKLQNYRDMVKRRRAVVENLKQRRAEVEKLKKRIVDLIFQTGHV